MSIITSHESPKLKDTLVASPQPKNHDINARSSGLSHNPSEMERMLKNVVTATQENKQDNPKTPIKVGKNQQIAWRQS